MSLPAISYSVCCQLLKQRGMNILRRNAEEGARVREVGRWRGEWEEVRREGLEQKMAAEVETRSLRAQVNSLQKVHAQHSYPSSIEY